MAGMILLGMSYGAQGQTPDATPPAALPQGVAPQPADQGPTQTAATAATAATTAGGTIHGSVKAGNIPLPGVAITATNTLTGKKFATTTDADGNYAMTIPKTGRYVVRAELAAFAPMTSEVRLTAEATDGKAEFALQLASRAAAEQAAGARVLQQAATALRGGTQALSMTGSEAGLADASAGGGDVGAALPSLSGLGGAGGEGASADSSDSVAVSGVAGTTNPLANVSEDQIRERVQGAMDQARQNGGASGDQINAVVSMLGGIMGGGGGFGGGGGGGGGRGGRGGGGGGGGNFRNFNPAQPHGAVFYQAGNSALNSAPWSPTLKPLTNPAAYSNRFGASIAGSPYIPGLTKPDTRQFVFINVTGQRNLNAFLPNPVRVPTLAERSGDFSRSLQRANGGGTAPVTLYDPATGKVSDPLNHLVNNNVILPGSIPAQALALLNYYPQCNINCDSTDPSVYNYQTISNAGSNNIAINTRYMRQLGKQAAGGPFAAFGGGQRRGGGNQNAPPVLRQNINASYNYSHSANDNRNIFLPLGGKSESDGNGVNFGYTISYGRLSNNASINWNRSSSLNRNYFTDTSNNPTATAGLNVPNQAQSLADPRFYNGLPSIGISNFAGLTNQTPFQAINQTIAFSDSIGWRHKRHNYRFGFDVRRVHADSLGGNNPLGSYTFTGYATSKPADQVAGLGGIGSGSGFADFLLGLPQSTSIQAGLNKIYLRENVYDAYAGDDWRVISNVTLNYSLRYEYFGPYTEKNNRMVNLDHTADFKGIARVFAGDKGAFSGQYPTSLVNPDRTMFEPRIGLAWSPKFKYTKNVVVRGGYGTNYNTGQYAVFARSLSHQAPFSTTENNTAYTPTRTNPAPNVTNCTTTQSSYTYLDGNGVQQVRNATSANLSFSNVGGAHSGFDCSTANAISNNFAVDKNYRLGLVQIYNLNLQKSFGQLIVMNIGYNGSKGSNLDVVGSPNATPSGVLGSGIAAFDYETSAAGSHSNSLVVSLQQRQRKGIALGATYTYAHSIDNASGVGGAVGSPVQDFYRLDLEEGNSSFDQRHNLTGNYLIELPFGPNREYLNKGGVLAKTLDGFSLSGSFTIGSGSYYTPQYSGNQAEASSANTFNQRPNRVAGQTITGPGTVKQFFNTAAFTAPAAGQYGTASQGSIEGPGTVSVNTALSRTVQLGGTNSFEARVTASNVFNTVQYNGINVNVNSANFGQVTSAAQMRALQVQARYRF